MKPQFGTDWRDQWDRVKRWHRRLDPIRAGPPENEPAKSDALDCVFAFYTNCYHLMDWLEADPRAPRRDSRTYVDSNKTLRVCRDFCNGLNHYRLDPSKSTTTYQSIGTTGGSITVTGPSRWWIVLEPAGEQLDMFDVADDCVKLWAAFLGEDPGAVR